MKFETLREQLEEIEFLSKGWRGIVYKARWRGKQVAIKVAKEKEKEYAIRKEGEILKILKGHKGFPKILLVGEDFIMYEFIEGNPIEKVSLSREEKALVYLKILDLIKVLDILGINKEELSCLDKNTLIDKEMNVYLLDFERGSARVKKRHNLSQFLQLLVREGYISMEKAIEIGKRYSKGEDVYDEVRRFILSSP